MRWLRLIGINLLVLAALLAVLEVAARAYIAVTRGAQSAGMRQRTLHLSYEPFVMYGPGWNRTPAPPRWPREPGSCRLLLVGGSTARAFPGDVLADALRRHSRGKRLHVINAAHGGYEARQEVVVAATWGPALRPDVLLSLDGANDLAHRLRVPRAGEFHLSSTYALYLKNPWAAPLAHVLAQSQLYNGIVRLVQRRSVGPPDQYADAIPVYIEAQRSLNVLAQGMGAARLMVLQPFSGFKAPLSPEEAAFVLYQYREGVRKVLFERTSAQLSTVARQDGVGYLDSRHIFDGERARVFVDDVHLTALGYERLADAIARQYAALAREQSCSGETGSN